jgi:putative transposase
MERKTSFAVDEYYHIYNRGTEKRQIFLDQNDKERFVKLLYLSNSQKSVVFRDIPQKNFFDFDRGDTLVDIGAYCLMPNHFHLLLREKIENGITLFMLKLGTSYSMYFNTKNKRTGRLFEGTFKATHADSDEYLQYLFAYIHLNPVKLIDHNWKERGLADFNKADDFLRKYIYSSYLDYLKPGFREEAIILSKKSFPGYFETIKSFGEYHSDCLTFTP